MIARIALCVTVTVTVAVLAFISACTKEKPKHNCLHMHGLYDPSVITYCGPDVVCSTQTDPTNGGTLTICNFKELVK